MHEDRSRGRCAALAVLLAALALAACGGGSDDVGGGPGDNSVPPLALPGPHAVACSNVALDSARVGADVQDFWEGRAASDGTPRYLGDVLSEPAQALSVTVNAPADTNLFGSFAGRALGFVVLACYPTAANNPRADYVLPNGQRVPHMHTGGDAPLFADGTVRYPVIAFSHGFAGSPLSGEHWTVLNWLASHGYVVVAPFHGDPRFADLRIDDFRDAVKVLRRLGDVIAMQALRPLAVSAALDLVLAHPQWRAHVDAAQVGGFGASMGGETMLLLGGAALTTSPGLSSTPVGRDARIKAAVGYVPYFGQPLLPAFGREQLGLERVTLPYLAIAGTADTTSPLAATQQGVERLDGPRLLVGLVGVEHGFDAASAGDILTWSLTFLDAQVRALAGAQARLSTMTSVQGGGDDRVLIEFDDPNTP